jgi:DNA-binding HxlR family transcriptional regulator
VVCGKWTLLIIRDLAEGCSRFCELERSLEGISPRTLSLRLRGLEAEGRALVPLIEQMRAYGRQWLNGHPASGNGHAAAASPSVTPVLQGSAEQAA